MQLIRLQAVLLSILLLSALLTAFRLTDDFRSQLIERFQAYNQQRPTEKVYLHTDRNAYLAGETIWLKGYLIDGVSHEVDTVSRVLHVELIGSLAHRIQLRAQLRAEAGYALGQLSLPDSLPMGTYQLRAYTNFMRNEPAEYFFTKSVTVLRSEGASVGSSMSVSQPMSQTINPSDRPDVARPDVQFLPEGGQLIEGIESRVAFKAVSPSGLGCSVNGFVLNAKKDTITGFFSQFLGMGSFAFKPEAGQTYTAYVKRADNTFVAYSLPPVLSQGVVVQVDNISSKKYVKVYVRHNKTSADTTEKLTLLAQTRGIPVQIVSIPLAKKSSLIQLPKADFPEGISQLTLFDERHKPLNERLVFVHKTEPVTVTLTTDKKTYKNREKVELTVTTTDEQGKPVAANLSLAAVDAQLTPQADSNRATLVSHLLLSSDLPGTVEQPDYYFDSKHSDRWQKLDLLLMTQGWRRFAWNDVLSGTIPPTKYPIERGLSLTGRVTRPNQKDISEKVQLTFLMAHRDSSRSVLMGETDATGNYAVYGLDFTDTTVVFIQGVKRAANRNLSISLDQLLTPTVTFAQVPYTPVEFDRYELRQFMLRANESLALERRLRNNGAVNLQAVTVKAKKIKERDNRLIYSNPSASVKVDLTNSAGAMTILDVLQGRVAGVQVTGFGLNARVQIRGAANFRGAVSPLFVLDGIPTDLSGIMNISVQDVDRIDVLKGADAAIYGSQAAGGVISVLTKRGSPDYDYSKDVVPGTLLAKLPGYAPIREFYTPRYDTPKPDRVADLDYRATLYWAPLIQTNADGKATLSFFTSDAKTTVRLQAEGITTNGVPGVGREVLVVK